MHIENIKWRFLSLLITGSVSVLAAQDSLEYAELFSSRFFEEYQSGARISCNIAAKPHFSFKNKVVIESGPLTLYYHNNGTAEKTGDIFSVSFHTRFFEGGYGRGQPNIARGIILGNTMMRLTPDPVSNYRMRDLKIRIKNYSYYPSFSYVNTKIENTSLYVFRYDNTYCAAAGYRNNSLQAGMAFYNTEEPIAETWFEFPGEFLQGTLNGSVTQNGFNHASADMIVRSGSLRWHAGAVWLASGFRDCDNDSKWGTGLRPGGRGFITGNVFRTGRWKIKNVFYGIYHEEYKERRFMTDATYKKKPFEIRIAYTEKNKNELSAAKTFPYALSWQKERNSVLKTRIKVEFSSAVLLDLQMQTDLHRAYAHALLARITYRKNDTVFRIQGTLCGSGTTILYFLRPLTATSYTIRRAPEDFAGYIDLVYAFMLGPMRCSLLFCNEGLSATMEMKL